MPRTEPEAATKRQVVFLRILPGTHHSLAGGRWRPLSRSLQTRATARWVSLQPRDFYTLARPHPESLTKRNETGSPCWGTLRRPWSVLKALGQSGSGSWAYLCSSTSQAAGEVRFIQDAKCGERGPEASGWPRGALRMVRGVCTTRDPNPSCARQWRYTTQLSERFGRKSRLGPPAIPS